MVFDECMSRIQLLKFGKEACGHISGSLESAKEGLDRFLPRLNVLAAGCGGKDIGCAEAWVSVDFFDDVKRLHHDQFVLGDFLNSAEAKGCEIGDSMEY